MGALSSFWLLTAGQGVPYLFKKSMFMSRTSGALPKTKVPFVPTGILQANFSPEDYLNFLVNENAPAELQDYLFNMLCSTVRDDRFLLYDPSEREHYLAVYKTLSDLVTASQQVYRFDKYVNPAYKK